MSQRGSVIWLGAVLLSLHLLASGAYPAHKVVSPDGSVSLEVVLRNGVPYYALNWKQKELIHPSRLGMAITGTPFPRELTLVGKQIRRHDESWTPVWGKTGAVRDHYREMTLKLRERGTPRRRMDVICRAYNDGIAFRYFFPAQSALNEVVVGDLSEFNFAGDYSTYTTAGEHAPDGPVKLSKFTEGRMPMVLEAGDHIFMAVHEAALFDFANMTLVKALDSSPFGVKARVEPSAFSAPMLSPWRVVILGERPGDLLTSNLLVNLNPPPRIEDTSWVRPGKAMWDWRVHGATYDGFTYGLNTESHKRFIEFAGGNNIQYFLIDANWYGPERDPASDPLTHIDSVNIPELLSHAANHGVRLILYLNDTAFVNHDMDKVLSTYQNWGVAGVKYGFMKGSGQEKVRRTVEVVQACAKYQLLVNFHDSPIPPAGDRRTYPNRLTREHCHAQQDARRSFSPADFLKTVFVNMVAGPLDMNNGVYALHSVARRPKGPRNDMFSTVVSENARCLIAFSGLTVLPDSPEEYARKADLFEFIKMMPATWDETRVLHGEIGKFITTARRSGEEWFIGSVINEEGGELDITLDFLGDGVYEATLYEDAEDTHYIDNREAYRVRKMKVRGGDVIKARMAPGGGHCMWIRKPVCK